MITENMLLSLRQTKSWVRFISILGFLSFILIVMSSLILFVPMIKELTNIVEKIGQLPAIFLVVFLILMYVFFAISYYFPSYFLFKYASAIERLLDDGGVQEMEEALLNQKSFWRFVGIFILLVPCSFFGLSIILTFIIPGIVSFEMP